MTKEKTDIGKLIDEETERRLAVMEQPDYVWPKKAGIGDAVAIAAVLLVCVVLIVLCMTGVIK